MGWDAKGEMTLQPRRVIWGAGSRGADQFGHITNQPALWRHTVWAFWRLQRRTTNHIRFVGSRTCFRRSETGTAVGGKGVKCFSCIFLLFKRSYKKCFSTGLLAPSGEEPRSSWTLRSPAPTHTSHRANEWTAVDAAPVFPELLWDSSRSVSSAKRTPNASTAQR